VGSRENHQLGPREILRKIMDPSLPFSALSLFNSSPRSLHPWLRSCLISALKLGPMPKHIAFIMDGNRRFARGKGEDVIEGHEHGFEALKKMLEFLLHLGIENVTVYAFSIDNFARPEREVNKLMEMARLRLVEICSHGQLLHEYSVRIRVLGRLDLLPDDVRLACLKAEDMTKGNTKGTLNFCFPYTSRDEMTSSIRRIVGSSITPEKITKDTIDSNLYTSPSPFPDLLVRTGGDNRLSDFMLWQSNETTTLHFIKTHWPDITVLDILPLLLGWQAEHLVKRAGIF